MGVVFKTVCEFFTLSLSDMKPSKKRWLWKAVTLGVLLLHNQLFCFPNCYGLVTRCFLCIEKKEPRATAFYLTPFCCFVEEGEVREAKGKELN